MADSTTEIRMAVKLACLVTTRLRIKQRKDPSLQFRLFRNTVIDEDPFDIFFLSIGSKDVGCKENYIVLLERKESRKKIPETFQSAFKIYKEFQRKIIQQPEEPSSGQNVLQNELNEARNHCLILFTNHAIPLEFSKPIDKERFPNSVLFSTGINHGHHPNADELIRIAFPEIKDENLNEFLSNLILKSENVDDEKFKNVLKNDLVDLLIDQKKWPRVTTFLKTYLSALQKLWTPQIMIADDSMELYSVIRVDMNEQYLSVPIDKTILENLGEKLKNEETTYTVVLNKSPLVRCSRIKQALEQKCPRHFVIITDTSLNEWKPQVLENVCKNLCEELVLNTDTFDEEIKGFLKRICAIKNFKIRVISGAFKDEIYSFLQTLRPTCTSWTERETEYERNNMPDLPLSRLTERDTTHGAYFEIKMAALLALRAQRQGLEYQLFTNVAALGSLDDLLLCIKGKQPAIYLIQLKHARNGGHVSMQSFHSKNEKDNGDFSLQKYFETFKLLCSPEGQSESRSMKRKRQALTDHDKWVLGQWDMNTLRILIFTNKSVQKPSSHPHGSSALDFPHEDLFKTGEKSNVFSFHNNDEQVWNFINDDDYRDKFLPRLRIFGSQADVQELDDLMENEINKIYQKPLFGAKEYVKPYIEQFKIWAESPRGDPISNSSQKLERVIAEDLRKRARIAAENGAFKFKDEHCERLINEIHEFDTVLYLAELVPQGHRVAKVQQVLDAEFPGRWLYADDRVVRDLPVSALTAASKVCDVIVVDVNRVPIHVKQFLKNLQSMKKKKIIVLSSESAKTTEALRGIVEFQHTTNEDWRLMHLTEEAQNKILEKMVEFQGSLMILSRLEDAWGYERLREDVDGQLLSALLRGDATLGEAPAPPPDVADDACALRVPRTLVHHSVLRREALVQTHDSVEHFVLWGFSREEVKKLRREREAEKKRRRESNDMEAWMQQATWEERYTELPDSIEFTEEGASFHFTLKCIERVGQNVHLVQNVNGILLWRATRGSSNAVEEFVQPLSERCKRPYRCSCFHKESDTDADGMYKDRALLLLGEPGIGKSTYLYNLSLKQRENNPEHWSVMIRLLDHLELIHRLPEPGEMVMGDVERLIAAAAVTTTPCAAAARRFFSAGLLATGKVNLFVDGVDEVIPKFKDKALKLLELLIEHKKKDTLLWIASRPEVDESLRQRLNCNSVSLRPLSYEEQLTYLKSKWKFHEDGFSENTSNILAEELVNAFCKTPVEIEQQDSGKQIDYDLYRSSLLAVPLYLRMAAEAFAEDAREALITENKLLKGHISRLHLVQRFIEGQRSRFRERYEVNSPKNQITNSAPAGEIVFDLLHQNYAMLEWTSSNVQHSKQQFEETIKEYQEHVSREKSGILWKLEDGRVQFVHYMFVEYYVAMWIFQNFSVTQNTEKFVLAALDQRSHSMVSLFLDLMLAENFPLHNAIIDDRNIDESLLTKNKEVVDLGGRSALHLAAVYGRTGVVDALLDAGCDSTKCDTLLRKTPLQYADTTLQLEIIEIFLQRKFDAKELMSVQRACIDPFLLRRAATKDLVLVIKEFLKTEEGKLYLKEGEFEVNFNLNIPETNDETSLDEMSQKQQMIVSTKAKIEWPETLLHIAAGSGAVKVAQLLLEKGFKVDSLNKLKQTPLNEACSSNQKGIVIILLEQNANVNHQDLFGNTPIHRACGNLDILKLLMKSKYSPQIDTFNAKKGTPLYYAVNMGKMEVVEFLLSRGADASLRNDFGQTPLHAAAHSGNKLIAEILFKKLTTEGKSINIDDVDRQKFTPLHLAAHKCHLEMTQWLITNGADVNLQTESGDTPLHFAALNEDKSITEHLLSQGADIHSVNNQNATPLHFASQQGNLETVKLLLSGGANVSCRIDTGEQPIHLAAGKGHELTVKYLLSQSADIHSVNNQNRTPLHFASEEGHLKIVKLLLSCGAKISFRTDRGEQPIHRAASGGHELTIKYLLSQGADIHSVTIQNATPLHCASQAGHLETVKLLLSGGANVSCRINSGEQPIHLAAGKGHELTVKYLLSQGADIHSVNKRNATPLHFASEEGHLKIVKLLQSRGADVNRHTDTQITPIDLASFNC